MQPKIKSKDVQVADIEWASLGFTYIQTDYSYLSIWKDGQWDQGNLITENTLTIAQSAPALHYGQQCFEGLKAYRTKDGDIQLFRPDENAKRMKKSCDRLMMPEFPQERFIQACQEIVAANARFVPPYGSGATLYLRPFLIGTGDNLGVRPASEYMFCILVAPVGPYFKGGMKPVSFVTSDFDRAAPYGTGAAKVGGNYAASLKPHDQAVKEGFADCIYLDPATHTKIEEVGAANFFGITHDDTFITPSSPSILPSITKYSLLQIARDYLKMPVQERDCLIDQVEEFKEAGACGTAAVISPIGSIVHKGKKTIFHSETEVGPVTKKLYDTLYGIQFGDIQAPDGWIVPVE